MHTVFIWLLAIPLIMIVITFQDNYKQTTAVQPVLTLDVSVIETDRMGASVQAHHSVSSRCQNLSAIPYHQTCDLRV